MAKELVMVMGVQRSGTNALFGSLASDQRVTAFNESIDSPVFRNYRLRPEDKISSALTTVPGPVLLKPICETLHRTFDDVRKEFRAYALRIVWIYRDPVNVFYSMHRTGWIPFNDIGSDRHIEQWNKRNSAALEFYKRAAESMAIVRYEDFLVDRRVFAGLCDWLGFQSKSFFRPDSGSGRSKVPRSVQRKIDGRIAEILQALDRARLIRPRRAQYFKHRVSQGLIKGRRLVRRTSQPDGSERQAIASNNSLTSATRCLPTEIAGLKFWLDCAANPLRNGEIVTEFSETGPSHMSASTPANGPYYIISGINRNPALLFPAEKSETRRKGGQGILAFGADQDWSFICDGRPFAVFAIFKPTVPGIGLWLQERAVLFRIGASDRRGPAFVLQWNSATDAAEAIIVRDDAGGKLQPEQQVASTPRGSHPRAEWRLISVQHTRGDGGTLLSFANDMPGAPCRGSCGEKRINTTFRAALQLGGVEGETDSLFFGAVAELLVFSADLQDEQRIGITRYLTEKYRL